MNALVVPTNSAERLMAFLSAWAPWPWDRVIIVYDGPEIDFAPEDALGGHTSERLQIYCWADIELLAPEPAIFSRRDSAIRSFGFWRAWLAGAEIVFTLDDDCYPTEDDLVATHRSNLYATPAWTSSVPGLRVRGTPYRNPGVLADVQVSMGLWAGIPDLDAVCTLAGSSSPAVTAAQTRVMPAAQFFALSGMNLAFRRDVACLMYFPPMGAGQPFARFDDIWCGLLLQRVCRHLGYSITCGRPLINHRRASDPFVNLVKEAPGIGFNEALWETIAGLSLSRLDPRECMLEAGAGLASSDNPYLAAWGEAISQWCELFVADSIPVTTRTVAGT